MREIRTSGSEGGGTLTRPPYPYPGLIWQLPVAVLDIHRLGERQRVTRHAPPFAHARRVGCHAICKCCRIPIDLSGCP